MNDATIEQIVVQKKDLFDSTVNIIYQMMCDDPVPMDNFKIELMDAFSSPDSFISSMRDGGVYSHMPSYMEQIESLHNNKKPFVVVVIDNDKVWSVVNGDEIQY